MNKRERVKANKRLAIYTGRKLREIRLKRGLYQVDVAVLTGLRSNYVSRIERGKSRLTVTKIVQICRGLKIRPEEILSF